MFRDPKGLLPTEFHYNLTYELAKAAFGSCGSLAKVVAQANADQDALPGFWSKVKFVLGVGDGWKKGSIHFGGPVDQKLRNAFDNCDDYALGAGLHGLQDDLAHSGVYSNPAVHYYTSALNLYLSYGQYAGDADSLRNFHGVNAASQATAAILRQYQRKCLRCCVPSR